ncbi:hypothetical protein [Subtercola boreus]|nr:hypothetical protein [Subtercola boreus]
MTRWIALFDDEPSAAVIDSDERWCAVAGVGLIVYFLSDPFATYAPHQLSEQWTEVGLGAWRIDSLRQIAPSRLEVLSSGSRRWVTITSDSRLVVSG